MRRVPSDIIFSRAGHHVYGGRRLPGHTKLGTKKVDIVNFTLARRRLLLEKL